MVKQCFALKQNKIKQKSQAREREKKGQSGRRWGKK